MDLMDSMRPLVLLAVLLVSFHVLDIGQISMNNSRPLCNGLWCVGTGAVSVCDVSGDCLFALENKSIVYHIGMYGMALSGLAAIFLYARERKHAEALLNVLAERKGR